MRTMNWQQLLCPKRLGASVEGCGETGRSEFHKDFDRIVFSSAFRRMGKKTQVHPLASNDHIHTRLTHSIEVASVGRSLGINVGERIRNELPDGVDPLHLGEIVESACLAHDIGNPPFGHAGEEAIRNWFSQPRTQGLIGELDDGQRDDLLYFDGNAQSFRMVTQLEHDLYEGGMRLTYATLGALLKYPWTALDIGDGKKFGAFMSEREILEMIAEETGLVRKDEWKWCRHPLAFLAEAADDICYRILDLEDAHEMRILSFDEVRNILEPLCEKDSRYNDIVGNENLSARRRMSFLRAKAIGRAVRAVSDVFVENQDRIMEGSFEGELISECTARGPLDEAKRIAVEKVFRHPRKIELEIGSFTTIGILLNTFCSATKEQIEGSSLSFRSERILSMMGVNAPTRGEPLYRSYQRVLDYISGMTDSYATYMAKQIGGMAN